VRTDVDFVPMAGLCIEAFCGHVRPRFAKVGLQSRPIFIVNVGLDECPEEVKISLFQSKAVVEGLLCKGKSLLPPDTHPSQH
jgi:hypothetical protein